jgi:heme A synthase
MQHRHQAWPLSFAAGDSRAIASASPLHSSHTKHPKEIVMNPIRTIRRLATTLTGLAAALAAAVAGAPAAFAQPSPPPGPPAEVVRFGPVAHTFNGVTGDMTGWQIALIAVGAAILGAIVAVLLDRTRAARSHRPATAA